MLLSPTKIIGCLLIPFDVIVSFKPTDVIVVYCICCLFFYFKLFSSMLLTVGIVTVL